MIEVSKSVIVKDKKYLLLKRADHSRSFPGLWDFAGGKHEPGETALEAVVPETMEETGFVIEPGSESFSRRYHEDGWDILFHYFTPKILSGDIKLSSDHSQYKWFTKEEIEKLEVHPAISLYFK